MTRSPRTTDFFVAGGALRPNAPSYVERPADDELFELACAGEFAYVLTARQMGKSSLMHRTARRLKKKGIRAVRIDLTNIGTVSVEKWYLGVLVELSHQLRLPIDLETWWQEHSWLGSVQRFTIFLRDVVFSDIQEPVVIFIDEIDVTLGLDFSDDFFAAIRSLYNARAQDATFERLTFVLLGLASPPDLIKDRTKTPFNIGQGVLLQDFSRHDAATLQAGLEEDYPEQGEAIFTRIYHWTHGHPYLTQKLCQEVVKGEKESWAKGQINELVEETFLLDRSLKDENLRFVQNKILTHPRHRQLLGLYRKVHNGKKVADDAQSPLQSQLKLSGLIKVENGDLGVRNEIYRGVFDLAWIKENTPTNWIKRLAITSVLLIIFLFGVLAQSTWASIKDQEMRAKFYEPDITSTERVVLLAELFQLQGFIPPADYDYRANQLFYSISRNEQLALFESYEGKEGDLALVVEQLYITLADVDESDSTRPLLEAMDAALEELDQTPQTATLRNEIGNWLLGRLFYRQTQYNEALTQYELALASNSENPATLYERARVLTELLRYEEALANLESIVAIANRTSSPTTPTPAAGTPSPTFTPTSTAMPSITITPTSSSSATLPSATPNVGVTPTDSPVTTPDGVVTATPTLPVVSTRTPQPTATPVLSPFTSEFDTPRKMIEEVTKFIESHRQLANALNAASLEFPDKYPNLQNLGLASNIKGTIIVGSKDFTEQKLLGRMLVLKLQEAGYEVEDKTGLGETQEVRAALENGEIDIYWEYTGTALADIHGFQLLADPNEAFDLAKRLDEPKGLMWLNRANFNNTYTLVVQQSTAEQGITTLEELADFMNDNDAGLTLCVENEFIGREQDGLLPLQERYGFAFKEENIEVVELANRLQNYEKLLSGECDVAEGFDTDGQIAAWGLHKLSDTLQFFPPYNPAPVIRQERLDQDPELANILGEIGPRLDERTMQLLNACVDLGLDRVPNSGDEESVEDVARLFIETGEIACSPPKIVVGSKLFTEQLVLGKMLVLMLQEAGYEVVDQTGLGDTQKVRAALESGEIHLYWEYTGTALADIHGFQLRADPNEAFDLAKQLDEPLLVWLNRANFNNTYTLMVREETKLALSLTTLEELADYMNANDAPLTLCVEEEFLQREQDGLFPLQAHYGFAFKEENWIKEEIRQNITPNYKRLREGECDVAEGYMTDARAAAWGFHQLTDTLNFFPPYNPAPVIRQDVLEEQPQLEGLLGQIGPRLDQATMTRLNEQVDIGNDEKLGTGDEESPETVARLFLCEVGLLKQNCPPPEEPTTAPQCEELVLNGGFEGDGDGGWELPETAWPAGYSTEKFHSQDRALRVGIINRSDDPFSQSVAHQRVTIPSDAKLATLSYWYYPISNNLNDGDVQGALIYNSDLTFIRRKLLGEHSNEQAWIRQDHDLSGFIGEEVYIYFYVDNDGNGQPSAMYLDDVSLQVCRE